MTHKAPAKSTYTRARSTEHLPRREGFLAAGGSAPPHELMATLGVDLNDAAIWEDGFAVIEGWIDRLAR
jgi:oligoendopeptidase F